MSGLAVAAGAGVVLGGAQFFSGLSKQKKEEKALQNLKQPFYKIQDEVVQNKNIAEGLAGGGIPQQQKDYLTGQAERGLGSSLGAIERTGGGINESSMLLDQYNQQIGKIGAEDSAQHLNNIQYFMKANSDLAAEKTKQWSINEYQPYEAKLKELKQNIATDEQNKWAGLSTAISSGVGGVTANSNANLMKKLFSQGGKVSDPYASSTRFDPRAVTPGVQQTGATGGSPAGDFSGIDPGFVPTGVTFGDVSDNS